MTDKQIIIEKIKDLKQTYEEIKENSNVFTGEFTLASGAITALLAALWSTVSISL